MSHQDLLVELAREDDLMRREASRSVERGFEALLDCKRLVQRLSLNEEEEAVLYSSLIKLNNAGIALRVMLQIRVKHEQRLESGWADIDGSNGKLQSAALEYEADVSHFISLLQRLAQINRQELKELQMEQNVSSKTYEVSRESAEPSPHNPTL